MRKLLWITVAALSVIWLGCAQDIGRNDNAFHSATYPVFDPDSGKIPMPNNILINDKGNVALPTDGMSPAMKEFVETYLNTLDGFLADLPLSVYFSNEIDTETLTADSVALYDITDAIPLLADKDIAGAAAKTKKINGLQFAFDKDKGNLLTINHPYLKAGHTYVAFTTNAIKDKSGKNTASSMVFGFLKSKDPLVQHDQSMIPLDLATAGQLEQIRQQLAPLFALLEAGPAKGSAVSRKNVTMLWAFKVSSADRMVFDPEAAKIPLPNDLLMDPKTGKLNFPLPKDADCKNPKSFDTLPEQDQVRAYFFCFMNSMDGFSVTSVPQVNFDMPVDQSTAADGVKFFVTTKTGLQAMEKYTVDCTDKKCDGLEVKAGMLKPATKYVVAITKMLVGGDGKTTYDVVPAPVMKLLMLTNPLIDKDGHSTMPAVISDAQAAQLEPLRQMYKPVLDALAAKGIKRASLIGFFTFTTTSAAEVIFDPNSGVIPFPNDFLINFMTGKMDLPIPADASDAIKANLTQINQLDGFSTYTPIQVTFSRPLDTKSIKLADSIMGVVTGNASIVDLGDAQEVQKNPPDAQAMMNMKVQGSKDVDITQRDTTLIITPKSGHQYRSGHEYVLGLKKGLVSTDKDKNGKPYPVVPAALSVLLRSPYPLSKGGKNYLPEVLSNKDATMLEIARSKFFAPMFDALGQAGIKRDDITLLVMFRTLNTTKILRAMADTLMDSSHAPAEDSTTWVKSGDTAFDNFFGSKPSSHIDRACLGCSFKGYIRLNDPDVSDPQHPVFGKFGKDFRAATFKYDFFLPKGAGKFKILLFQHGLWGNKDAIVDWADELAEHGFAVIAIDAPYHGEHPINIDGKGTGFFSTDVFAVADNFREAALDQIQAINFVTTQIPDILKGQSYPDDTLDTSKVYYAGVSLGSIIGSLTCSIEPRIQRAALIVGAGHLTRILMETANEGFKKPILDALAAMGIKEGTPQWDQFFMMAQWALDQGDPINYLSTPATGIPMDYSKRYIVVEAHNDGFIPNTATNETVDAMTRWADKPPVFNVYPKDSQDDLCHPFFMRGCDASKYPDFQTAKDQAHQDVLNFLEQ